MAEKNLMVVIGAKTEGLTKGMADLTKNLQNVGKQATKIGKDLSKKLTAPIVAAGGLAVKAAVDFESAFAGVRKTVDATEEEFAALEQGIRDMAREIPAAATNIAGVAEAAGQLGIAKENILGFSRTMIDLGEATNLTADQAATALARLANITQMPQTEFDRLGSTIVALGNNLATTEAEIVEMGLRLAGAGSQIGMSEAQIMAFAGSLSSVGIAAEAGGSAFSRVMIDMQLAAETGGEKLESFASVAGMSASQFQRAFQQDAASAMIAFIQGLQSAEERGLSAIKVLDDMGISEIRMRDALLRAAGAGDLFTESINLATQAWSENTALTTEAEQRYATTASQLALLRNNITEVAMQFGELLIPILMAVVEKVGVFVDWLGQLDPAVKNIILVAGGLLAAIGPIVLVIGKVITAVTTLLPIIKAIGVVLGGLVSGAAAPFVLIGAAIAALIALVYHFRDEIGNAIVAMVNWVIESLQKMANFFVGIFEWIRDGVTEQFARTWDNIKAIVGWITDGFQGAVDNLRQKLQSFADFFAGIFAAIRDNTIGVFERMWDGIKAVINWIIGGINKMIDALNNISIDVPSWVPGFGGSKFGFNLETIPLLADGGLIRQPGVAVVGERGPELLHLPQGAMVEPLPREERQPMQVINNFYTNRELDEHEVNRRIELTMRRLELEYGRRF